MSKQKRKGYGFEKRVVEHAASNGVDATRQPGSGVYADYPSDGILDGDILIECKAGYTEEGAEGVKSFRVQTAWIDKVEKHAKRTGMRGGILVFRPDGSKKIYTLMDQNFFLSLLRERRQLLEALSK